MYDLAPEHEVPEERDEAPGFCHEEFKHGEKASGLQSYAQDA